MFIKENSINNFKQLFAEIKKYLDLQKEYAKVELTEKLSVLISTLVIGGLVLSFGTIAILYLSFALAYKLAEYLGGMGTSLSIIAGVLLLILLIIYLNRKRLIFNPVINFLANLFLNDSK